MKAMVYEQYGGPDRLRLVELPVPVPEPDQVLIAVMATSVNLSDWETLRGSPFYTRIGGLRRPRQPVLGSDIAGRVEAVGTDVTDFEPGDDVYGDNLALKGGFAEFAVAPATALAHKPPELSFAEASAIPQPAAIAVQGVEGSGPGQRVLINGAGGGSGYLAIQLAKQAGAHVTAVDNGLKLDFMASMGADEVIDYTTVDFTRSGVGYDLILDLVATRSVFALRRALAPGGRYRWVGGSVPTLLQIVTLGSLLGRSAGQRMGLLAVQQGPAHFRPLAERCVAGEIELHIDRCFPLSETPAALSHHGEGRARGKVVIEVDHNS